MSNYKGGKHHWCVFSSMIGERLCSSSILFLTLKINFVDRVITDRVNAGIYHHSSYLLTNICFVPLLSMHMSIIHS